MFQFLNLQLFHLLSFRYSFDKLICNLSCFKSRMLRCWKMSVFCWSWSFKFKGFKKILFSTYIFITHFMCISWSLLSSKVWDLRLKRIFLVIWWCLLSFKELLASVFKALIAVVDNFKRLFVELRTMKQIFLFDFLLFS